MKEVKKLRPFTQFLMTVGELPTSYLISLTYEEQLLWFCNFLQNQVIPALNNNSEAIIELQKYVENYFDNLDVQEEINNKLDEMAESGTLVEIISEYLNSKSIIAFDTVEEMLESTNLISGSYAKTLGYYSKNDGGGALYKITDDELVVDNLFVLELDNELKAEIIIEDNVLNILQFGAKNDNTEDCSSILNNLLLSDYNSIFIPQGQYLINNTVSVKSNKNIRGTFNGSNLNISNIGQIHFGEHDTTYTNIQLKDLTIRCNGDRSLSSYALYFENCNLAKIENCLIRSDNGTSKYNGVCFELTNNSLHCYDNKIINNQFQRAGLRFIKSTDNFIDNNIIWGNNLLDTGALTFEGACHNNSITNNHFATAELGALRIQDTCNQLRITNNYFDAQGIGINGNSLVEANISDNIFFHSEKAIVITSLTMSILSNNTFKDCDINDDGYSDILITTTLGGCTISENKHFRSSDESHTNKGLAYEIPDGSSNWPHNVINMATVWFTNFYETIDTSIYTRNHFVNCYPGSLFTNS